MKFKIKHPYKTPKEKYIVITDPWGCPRDAYDENNMDRAGNNVLEWLSRMLNQDVRGLEIYYNSSGKISDIIVKLPFGVPSDSILGIHVWDKFLTRCDPALANKASCIYEYKYEVHGCPDSDNLKWLSVAPCPGQPAPPHFPVKQGDEYPPPIYQSDRVTRISPQTAAFVKPWTKEQKENIVQRASEFDARRATPVEDQTPARSEAPAAVNEQQSDTSAWSEYQRPAHLRNVVSEVNPVVVKKRDPSELEEEAMELLRVKKEEEQAVFIKEEPTDVRLPSVKSEEEEQVVFVKEEPTDARLPSVKSEDAPVKRELFDDDESFHMSPSRSVKREERTMSPPRIKSEPREHKFTSPVETLSSRRYPSLALTTHSTYSPVTVKRELIEENIPAEPVGHRSRVKRNASFDLFEASGVLDSAPKGDRQDQPRSRSTVVAKEEPPPPPPLSLFAAAQTASGSRRPKPIARHKTALHRENFSMTAPPIPPPPMIPRENVKQEPSMARLPLTSDATESSRHPRQPEAIQNASNNFLHQTAQSRDPRMRMLASNELRRRNPDSERLADPPLKKFKQEPR